MMHYNGAEKVLSGYYVRRDGFGRIVFDLCPSDHVHLTADPPTAGYNQQGRCRVLLDQLVPEMLLGKKGRVTVKISFSEGEEEAP